MHVKINDANICILCIKETNGINADYRVFLRTVHHTRAPRKGGRAQPCCLAVALLLGSLPGVGIFGSLSQGLIQDRLQSQLVFQVFHLTRALENVKAISIFWCLICPDKPSAPASTCVIWFKDWQTWWAHSFLRRCPGLIGTCAAVMA